MNKLNFLINMACVIILIALNVVEITAQSKEKQPECHFVAFDRCINQFFYFTHRPNTTGIVSTEDDFILFCKTQKRVYKCMAKHLEKCGTDAFIGVFDLIREVMMHSLTEFCSVGPMRDNFLKFSPCINEKVKQAKNYREHCVNDLQAGFEHISSRESIDEQLDTFCCAFNKWEDCINGKIVEHCGKGGDKALSDLIEHASGGVPHFICKRDIWDHHSEFCKANLPPPGTQAKGRHSNNVLSKYFTLICPNVGY